MTKKFYLYDIFFVSNQNFTTEHVKMLKIPGFYSKFLKFEVLFRFPDKLATLDMAYFSLKLSFR